MRFLPLFLFLLLARPLWADPLPRLDGTITQTVNGLTAHANVQWEPPATLRIDIERSPESQIAAQTIVATGDTTVVFDPQTRRLRRIGANIAKQWWRGWDLTLGGPVNFIFSGLPFTIDPIAGRYLKRDSVLLGGAGSDAYYAATKMTASRFPAQIALTATSRLEKNDAGKILANARITLDAQNFPKSADVVAAGQQITFSYDLKPRTAPVDTSLPIPAAGVITEDDELQSPSSYTGTDASSLYNRGAALAANEDFPRAFVAWDAAAAAAPDATAPLIATFETAISINDLNRAGLALDRLATKTGVDADEVAARRAQLAFEKRDTNAAAKALEKIDARNLRLLLLRADVARKLGDIETARGFWRQILASNLPQIATQTVAAQNLALSAAPDEIPALLASVPAGNQTQQLARSLLQLRSDQTPETSAFADDALQISLAVGFERAGRDPEATQAWTTLEGRGNDATKNRARAHLMTLAARRGDAPTSLAKWHDWNAALDSQAQSEAARDALFDAWQKAFRTDTLQATLTNRANATGATEEDLRLLLAFQVRNGTPADVTDVIKTGAARFSNSPFWLGQQADQLITQANETHSTEPGMARREQLYDQALKLLDAAIAAAPDDTFYRFQKALAATQRGAKVGGVIDVSRASTNRANARKQTEALLAALNNDPDALVSAELQNLAFEGQSPANEAVKLGLAALDTAPNDGDRHALVSAARQGLAAAYWRLKMPSEAGAQWDLLLAGSRTAGEEAGLANSSFVLLESTNSTGGGAGLLTEIAGEQWDYSTSRSLLESVATRMANSPLAATVSTALIAANNETATLAATALAQKRVEASKQALLVPDAPPVADANLTRASRDYGIALTKLAPVAGSANRLIASRAAAFLAENADLPGEDRLALLRQAIAIEPGDAALRLALIGALDGDEGIKERKVALQTLDFSPEAWRGVSNAMRIGGDKNGALKIAEEAYSAAAHSPEIDANAFQRVAFALAKTAFEANRASRATEIYNGLALPQWNDTDRAASYLAQMNDLKASGKPDEATALNPKVIALQQSEQELQSALDFLGDVEN